MKIFPTPPARSSSSTAGSLDSKPGCLILRAMKKIALWSLLLLTAFGSVSCGLARSATQLVGGTVRGITRAVTG
jgi:hypothetical protein